MKFLRLSYLIGFSMLMLFGVSTSVMAKKSGFNTSNTPSRFSTLHSQTPENVQLTAIEVFEVEDDNETKTHIKTVHVAQQPSISSFSKISRAAWPKAFLQAPSLFYKSWQSYLQVFRI